MQNLIQNDVVLCYFQIGVEQSIIQCKKKSSLISSIALKGNKEKLAEQIDLVSSQTYWLLRWWWWWWWRWGGGGGAGVYR